MGTAATWAATRAEFAELQAQYGGELTNCTLTINRRYRTTSGKAYYSNPPRIVLAGWLLSAPLAEVIDTLRHEAAHILAGPDAAHGPAWRSWCRRLGCRPQPCYANDGVKAQYSRPAPVRYVIVCDRCGTRYSRRVRSRVVKLVAAHSLIVSCSVCGARALTLHEEE
jgi:SprT-like family